MKIEFYITQLLYRYQCVTVPGFGAFLTEIQRAQLIEGSHSFFPPKKMISFNSYLKNNDGLLANHIAQSEKISYDSAVEAIASEVFNWKKTLSENRTFSIKNIGVFNLNNDNNIIFTPSEQINYLTQSFGLSSFVSPAIKREIELQKPTNQNERIPIAFIAETKKSYSYLKYAAIFVLGLGITGTIGYPIYQDQIASETVLVEMAVQKQVQNKIQEATFFIQNPLPSVTLALKSNEETKLPYHIVAGAFRNETNAQKIFEQLIAEGYNAKRLEINKSGLYPVLYGSYATFAEAEKEKNEIQKTQNSEAWILIESL